MLFKDRTLKNATNIGALIISLSAIRIRLRGPVDSIYNKEPTQNSVSNYLSPYSRQCRPPDSDTTNDGVMDWHSSQREAQSYPRALSDKNVRNGCPTGSSLSWLEILQSISRVLQQ